MKILRYLERSTPRYGILEGQDVYRASGDLTSDLQKGERAGAFDDLTILTPVDPGKIVAVGLNYALHVTENDPTREVPTEPVIFMKPTSSLLPPRRGD